MVQVLCADKVRTRPAITSTSPLQSLSEAPTSSAQKRLVYLANTLIDAALGTGRVNKRVAFQNSLGTRRFLPTRLLTRLGTGPKGRTDDHIFNTQTADALPDWDPLSSSHHLEWDLLIRGDLTGKLDFQIGMDRCRSGCLFRHSGAQWPWEIERHASLEACEDRGYCHLNQTT
jgi:hypothetical protein